MWKATTAAVQAPPPKPRRGGQWWKLGLKIVMIVVVCLAAVGIGAIAAGYYAVHKVKQAVVAKAESYGVDLKSIPSPVPSSNASTAKVYKPCEILSEERSLEPPGRTH